MTSNNERVDLWQFPELEAQMEEERTPEIIRSEIEKQIRTLAAGKAQWFDNLPQELMQAGAAFSWDLQHDHELRPAIRMGIDGVYSDHVDRMNTAVRAETG